MEPRRHPYGNPFSSQEPAKPEPRITSAKALGLFRRELEAEGFHDFQIEQFVAIAARELLGGGLTVTLEESK